MDAKNGDLTLRLEVGFPANGRTVNSGELIKILFDFLPVCVKASLFYRNLDARKLEQVRALAEDQTFIRKELAARNLTAFVANGAVLPRESGVSPLPMKDGISKPRSADRYGDPVWYHADRWWRLSRQIHSA